MRITGGNALLNANLILSKIELSEGMKVADLGCGISGHFVFPAARMVGKDGVVFAVDILKNVLESVEKRISQDNVSNVKIIWSDLEMFGATPIESGSLDAAMYINTLYLSQKRTEMMREAVRLIKRQGKLIVVEWKNIAVPFGPSPEQRVKEAIVKDSAAKLGLQLNEEFEAGPYHYGLVFTKM